MKEGELWSAEVKNCYLKVEATIIKWRQQFESRGNDLWFESKSWGSDLNESGGNIWKQRQWFESEGLPLESWDNAQRTVKDKKGFPPTSDFEVGGEAGVWVCQMEIFILSLGVSDENYYPGSGCVRWKFLSWVWVCRKFYPFGLFKLRINAKVLKKCKLSIMSDKNKEERHKQCNISKDSSWNYQLPTHLCSAPDRNKSLALLWLFFCEWLKLIKDKIIPL